MQRCLSGARRSGVTVLIMIAGFAMAMMVGIAIAKTFTLKVEKNARVTNQQQQSRHETIATFKGFAVYLLTGDSKHHPECLSKACLAAWPPVTVPSGKKPTKAPGIAGRLGVWRHKAGRRTINQVTLAGHPLYTFAGDSNNGAANGQGITIGPHVWQVITASASGGGGSPGGGGSGTASGSTTSTDTSTSTTASSSTSATSTSSGYWS